MPTLYTLLTYALFISPRMPTVPEDTIYDLKKLKNRPHFKKKMQVYTLPANGSGGKVLFVQWFVFLELFCET
jgi:hypothetical protein